MAETGTFLAGNLTSDPELRHTTSGIARGTFRVAVSSRVRDGEQWRDGEPAFYTVVVWRDQAEHAAQSLSKRSRVVVEVVADELGPSLRWATATPSRATRPSW
jgi:single-strand DNA-binding protein